MLLLDPLPLASRHQGAEVLLFSQRVPRGSMLDYESLMSPASEWLLEHMRRTKSTAETLSEYFQLDGNSQPIGKLGQDPFDCLFAIIQSDTIHILHDMDVALGVIGQDMLVDALIQQNLVPWRHILERFSTELNRLEASLSRFTRFLTSFQDALPVSASIETRLQECTTRINHLRSHTNRTQKLLLSNVSILESKLGIAEAESVTKLTELAFFFIPLSFSASIFSMQVKELSTAQVSLSAFFILAISISICSYALRLLIRSQRVLRLRQTVFQSIRREFQIDDGHPVPTTAFLRALWRRLGYVRLLVLTIVTGGLLALVWTRSIRSRIKIGITVLISIPYVLSFLWIVIKQKLSGLEIASLFASITVFIINAISRLRWGIIVSLTSLILRFRQDRNEETQS